MNLPPCPDPFNMAAYVLAHAETAPDKIALELLGNHSASWTYAELSRDVRGIATGLLRQGLKRGDRVLIRLGHDVAVPLVYLAALAVELIPVPVSSQLTRSEVTAMARRIVPAMVVQDACLPAPDIPTSRINAMDVMSWRALPPAAFVQGDPDRPGYIVFTSGTSSEPHAVLHAHRAVWARRTMISDWADLRETDRVLHAGSFNWTYTMGTGLIDPWVAGATALIAVDATPPAEMGALLAGSRATIFAAVPGIYRRILRCALPSLPDLRHGLSAGEKLPEPLRQGWREATGTDLHEAFGQSECSTFISGSPNNPSPADALGQAQTGRRIAILGTPAPLPPESDGRLAIHRDDPGLLLGYLNEPDAISARYRGEWFLTGDRARIDRYGWVYYLGREDDLLNAGGYRISPHEIEAAAGTFPCLAECAAFTREVQPGIEVIALAYVSDTPLDEDALGRHCGGMLARYKQPKVFVRLDALPRSANGKLLRRALKDGA